MGRKVDIANLLDAHQVAEMLGLSNPNGVAVYRGRFDDFPEPVIDRGRGRPVMWVRQDIIRWQRQRQRISQQRAK